MLSSLLAVAVLASFPQQDAKNEKPVALAQAVPQDAVFFVQATRLDTLRADMEASAWYGFWKDEELKPIREWFDKKVADLREKGEHDEESFGADPLEMFDALHGSIAGFAVLQKDFKEPAMGLLLEPGEPRGRFEELYAKLLDHEKKNSIASTAEYAGVELNLFESQDETPPAKDGKHSDEPGETAEEEDGATQDGLDHSVMFDAGGYTCLLVAGTRETLLEMTHGVIDRASGKDPAHGFDGSPALAQARASVPSAGRIEVFVDLARAIAKAQDEHPSSEEEERLFEALGIDDLRWVYATGDVGKGEAVSFDLAVQLPADGYLREWLDCLGRIPREMAGMAPRSSSAISLVQFDVWGLWQSAWKMAREMSPESADDARSQMDAALQQMGGGDIEKDFFSQFDGRFATFNVAVPEDEWKAVAGPYLQPTTSALSLSGSATLIGLKDPAAVSKFLGNVLAGIGIGAQVETEEFQGTTIQKFAMGPSAGVQWAFTKKGALISQYPTALRAALRMEGAEAKDSALEKESFKPLFEANADASVLSLATTAESIKSSLTAVQTMVGAMGMGMEMAGSEEGGALLRELPLAHLPSGAAVDRHFKGTVVTAVKRKGSVLHVRMSSK